MAIYNNTIFNITANDCQSIEAMAKSAAKIAFYNFKWQFVTLVLYNATLLCGVNAFLRSYKKNAVVGNDTFISIFAQRTKQFVIFGTNLENIHHILVNMEAQKYDTTAKYLIICQSLKGRECDEVDALEDLWHRRIMNVIFINDKFNNGTSGYYYEFGEECKNTPPMKVNDWDSCVYTNESRYCAGKFPIPLKNMYRCPVIVSTFLQPPYMYINDGVPSGADGDLLRIIIHALNATLVLMTPTRGAGWGNIDSNGSWVGSIGDIYYDLANMSMASAAITESRYNAFELSGFYYTINLVWITHPPTAEPVSYKLLRPFMVDTRIALVLSFLFVVVLALFFKTNFCKTISRTLNSGHSPDSVVFLAWQMCMGQTITILPLKMSVLYLILFWIWYCFLMRTFYQVHLINSLKTEFYQPQFSHLEEAIEAGYPFGGGLAMRDYYAESPLIYENWDARDSSVYNSTMLNLTHGMKYVLVINAALVQKFLRTPGRKLHILSDKVNSSPTGIFLKKFSPFTLAVNNVLEKLVEFGFPQMMFKNYTASRYVKTSSDDNKPIKFIYCTGCYIILIVGWVLSFIVFMVELNKKIPK